MMFLAIGAAPVVDSDLENTSATPGTHPENYFRFVPPPRKTTDIDWASLRQLGTVDKTRERHRAPSGNTTSGLVPPRRNPTELDQASLEQSRGIE